MDRFVGQRVSSTVRWPVGVATGIGSMPGTDPEWAARAVIDSVPDLPHLVELPARGAPSGMIGRTAALLAGLAVDLQPAGWRIVDRPGADHARAVAALRQDLDVLEESLDGYAGPLKIQAAGPLTLAALLEKARGDKVLADHGARRDLTDSLAEGLAAHVTEIARRTPGAEVLLQLDEPLLPTVLDGGVPTISGFGRLRAVEPNEAEQAIARVGAATSVPYAVHCCAPDVPFGLLHRAGVAAVSFDAGLAPVGLAARDELAGAVEAGVRVLAGLVPTEGDELPATSVLLDRVVGLWRHLDQPLATASAAVVVTPTCGLAGATPAYAVAALRRAGDVARALAEASADG